MCACVLVYAMVLSNCSKSNRLLCLLLNVLLFYVSFFDCILFLYDKKYIWLIDFYWIWWICIIVKMNLVGCHKRYALQYKNQSFRNHSAPKCNEVAKYGFLFFFFFIFPLIGSNLFGSISVNATCSSCTNDSFMRVMCLKRINFFFRLRIDYDLYTISWTNFCFVRFVTVLSGFTSFEFRYSNYSIRYVEFGFYRCQLKLMINDCYITHYCIKMWAILPKYTFRISLILFNLMSTNEKQKEKKINYILQQQ